MERLRLHSTHSFLALTWALPMALACSTSTDDGGGSADSPLGQQMAQLGDLADDLVGQNQEAYDGVAHAADYIASAFGAAPATLSTKGGVQDCLPDGAAGVTHAFSPQANSFSSTEIPGAPPDAARFNIYETSNGVASETVVGSLDVRCSGVFPSVNVGVSVTVDEVVLLDLLASNLSFGAGYFSASLSGFLSNSDGTDQIPFGMLGASFISIYDDEFEMSVSRTVDFGLGENVFAQLDHSVSSGQGFPPSEYGSIHVYEQVFEYNFEAVCQSFDFRADLQNMGGGLEGPGVFCAPPPIADGYNYNVACFTGPFDDLVVGPASVECASAYFSGDATQVGQETLNQIQRATDGLLGMSNAVFGVARVGGEFAMAVAESMEQPF